MGPGTLSGLWIRKTGTNCGKVLRDDLFIWQRTGEEKEWHKGGERERKDVENSVTVIFKQ